MLGKAGVREAKGGMVEVRVTGNCDSANPVFQPPCAKGMAALQAKKNKKRRKQRT